MNKKLHIVCLDAPAPPDYGGAIDMFYKIKALAESGIEITLHYFKYKKERSATALKAYCAEVIAYNRKNFLQTLSFSKPHIVASRVNKQLIKRLNEDDTPILIEGIHVTGIIPFLQNKNRKISVRLHNDEAIYYKRLRQTTTNFFKYAYYKFESFLLARYQKKLPKLVTYFAISEPDAGLFRQTYQLPNMFVLPPFIPWFEVTSKVGKGDFCLYHGNLGVAENEAAAAWLIDNVFSKLNVPFFIAGKKIPNPLRKKAGIYQHIQFKENLTETELNTLIAEAHIHVLPDFNATGMKLKLLHALFCGRFCITQSSEIKESSTIAFAKTADAYIKNIEKFRQAGFTEADKIDRNETVFKFNNAKGATMLNEHLW